MKQLEHRECMVFSKYLKSINAIYSKIANEIRTPSIKQRMYQKAEWLNSWLPDYVIIVRCCSWNKKLIFLEMKKQKGWVLSPTQKIRIKNLLDCWINAFVAKGAIEAIDYVQKVIVNW